MRSNLELAIANLEMLATVIQSKAENVARLASVTTDEAHSVQLWGLAERPQRLLASGEKTSIADNVRSLSF